MRSSRAARRTVGEGSKFRRVENACTADEMTKRDRGCTANCYVMMEGECVDRMCGLVSEAGVH